MNRRWLVQNIAVPSSLEPSSGVVTEILQDDIFFSVNAILVTVNIIVERVYRSHAGRRTNAGRTTKFAPVKSLRFSELILGILLFEFRFTVFFPLGCGVDSPPFSFFKQRKEKPPKRPGAVD